MFNIYTFICAFSTLGALIFDEVARHRMRGDERWQKIDDNVAQIMRFYLDTLIFLGTLVVAMVSMKITGKFFTSGVVNVAGTTSTFSNLIFLMVLEGLGLLYAIIDIAAYAYYFRKY